MTCNLGDASFSPSQTSMKTSSTPLACRGASAPSWIKCLDRLGMVWSHFDTAFDEAVTAVRARATEPWPQDIFTIESYLKRALLNYALPVRTYLLLGHGIAAHIRRLRRVPYERVRRT
ncbi:hypothetical protein [Streptomyces sp. NPDC002133]|uniref:hypothetical protein n=1 Tax=Streptomyces sp. NPDC002133 TaxID=3154409 RepID=UPI003322988F